MPLMFTLTVLFHFFLVEEANKHQKQKQKSMPLRCLGAALSIFFCFVFARLFFPSLQDSYVYFKSCKTSSSITKINQHQPRSGSKQSYNVFALGNYRPKKQINFSESSAPQESKNVQPWHSLPLVHGPTSAFIVAFMRTLFSVSWKKGLEVGSYCLGSFFGLSASQKLLGTRKKPAQTHVTSMFPGKNNPKCNKWRFPRNSQPSCPKNVTVTVIC